MLCAMLQAKGGSPKLEGAPYWMDSALIAALGIPTVVFEPIGGGLHSTEEWAGLESVQQCLEVLMHCGMYWCTSGKNHR